MRLHYSDNFEDFKRRMRYEVGPLNSGASLMTTATIRNFAPFAKKLQDLDGYYVINPAKLREIIRSEFGKSSKRRRGSLNPKRVQEILRRSIVMYVDWLRSYTGTTDPIRKGGPKRKAHPGKWGDITGYLNNAWEYRINNGEWEADPKWRAGLAKAEAKFRQMYPNAQVKS